MACGACRVKKRKSASYEADFHIFIPLVGKNQVTGQQHVNEIDYAEEPTPTDEQESKENNNVDDVFRSEHHG